MAKKRTPEELREEARRLIKRRAEQKIRVDEAIKQFQEKNIQFDYEMLSKKLKLSVKTLRDIISI